MENARLATFLAVIEAGSMRAAAKKLGRAPSAVSRQVALLQQEAGLPILRRVANKVEPTAAGEAIVDFVRRRAGGERLLRARLEELSRADGGEIRLMCGEGFLADLMSDPLRDFVERHPNVRFDVLTGSSGAMVRALAENRCDLALAFSPIFRQGVLSVVARRQPLRLVVPANHRLAGEEGAWFKEVAHLPTALLPADNGIRGLLAQMEAGAACSINARTVTDSIDCTRRFVGLGLGVTYLPSFCIDPDNGNLRAVRLLDPLFRNAQAHLLISQDFAPPPLVSRLVTHLASTMAAFR